MGNKRVRPVPQHRAETRKRLRAGLVGLSVVAAGLSVTASAPVGAVTPSDFTLDRGDLEFIINQIQIAENHAAGGDLVCADPNDVTFTCVADPRSPFGLRTVDGQYNNLTPGRENYGRSGREFPRGLPAEFKGAESMAPNAPATSYAQKSGLVVDSKPRTISNLVSDQTADNPAALAAMARSGGTMIDHDSDPATPDQPFIPNVSPDGGLSAPFNSWFTLFGQFFDHGLDLVSKGGSGSVMMPLKPDDPLYDATSPTNFLILTRATNGPGPDGILGNADDRQEHQNRTTPFVDQNQTYTSQPSHQVFLREYEATPDGPAPTGRLLGDSAGQGLSTWADVKAQARTVLGLALDDNDVHAVPLIETDPYGRFVPGPNGLPQVKMPGGTLVEGDLANPVDVTGSLKAPAAFLDDIAHPAAPSPAKSPDANTTAGSPEAVLPSNQYDDELLAEHFATGDGRGNENIGLTAVHHVFHAEHNRQAAAIDQLLGEQDAAFRARWTDTSGPWDYGERLFQAARFVTEMQYQHLVFEEFGRKLQPAIAAGGAATYSTEIDPAIQAEFAHVVYRFGHSMLTDTVDRKGFGTQGLSLLDAFLNPESFTDGGRISHDEGAAAVIQGMVDQVGSGIDEFVVDTLRNNLLGLPLDLGALNLARARETGVPSLNKARQIYFASSGSPALQPYRHWRDFGEALTHPESLVNFVAAYGKHPSIASAGTLAGKRAAAASLVGDDAFMTMAAADSGVNDVDFWIGGLAERPQIAAGMLGSTFNAVFQKQMEDLQNGDRFYYLTRTEGLNLFHQLEASSFADLVMRNTDATNLPADLFAAQDLVIDVTNPPTPLPEGVSFSNANGWRYTGDRHARFYGSPGNDTIRAGLGDDSLWGAAGNDRLNGDQGNDALQGGAGNDILTDVGGDDVLHGAQGSDYLNGGPGLDLLFGGSGSDLIDHSTDLDDGSFGGQGNDLILGGTDGDGVQGDEGSDWLEGRGGADVLSGDNANPLGDSVNGGSDVLVGGDAQDRHFGEGGNDVFLGQGPDRHDGQLGFDWISFKLDPQAVNADLDLNVALPANVAPNLARYGGIEAMSGWAGDDILRGVGQVRPGIAAGAGHELTQAHLDEIAGLRNLLGGGIDAPANPRYAGAFMSANATNNLILGGGGSDILEGRAGDDFLDGDAYLDVYIARGTGNAERADGLNTPTSIAGNASFAARIAAGSLTAADLSIRRAIATAPGGDDVVFYNDNRAAYTVRDNGDGTHTITHTNPGAGQVDTGTDIVQNIERVQFADETVALGALGTPGTATGSVGLSTLAPVEDVQLSVGVTNLADPQGTGPVSYTWQHRDADGAWVNSGTGATFTPGDLEAGRALRVLATFTDGGGDVETLVSVPTAAVVNVNDVPTGLAVTPVDPVFGTTLETTGLVDGDGVPLNDQGLLAGALQWQRSSTGAPGSWSNIASATGQNYTVGQADLGEFVRARVVYTDGQGTQETVFSAATNRIAALQAPGAPTATALAAVGGGTVDWAPATTSGQAITSYEIEAYREGTAAPVRTITGLGPELRSYLVDGLTAETRHRFRVRAVNAGGPGAWSELTSFVEVIDGASPTVTGRSPLAGITGTPVDASVTVTFSKRVLGVSETSLLVEDGASNPVAGVVSYDDAARQARFTPSAPLAQATTYTVRVTSAITDRATPARELAPSSWTFTTVAPVVPPAPPAPPAAPAAPVADTVPPALNSRTPGPGSRNVARGASVRIGVSEPVSGVRGSSVQLRRADGRLVKARVTYAAATGRIVIDPRANLRRNTAYRVVLTSAIRDAAGNPLPRATWTFRTKK